MGVFHGERAAVIIPPLHFVSFTVTGVDSIDILYSRTVCVR
jgi:hypothetical protein